MHKGKELTPHIGIFGRRNIGKSSFINALIQQDVAIVSDIAGTTTDPVKKTYEILGFGPVVLIDTAGIDDSGYIGEKRVKKTLNILNIIDLGILLISDNIFENPEINIVNDFIKNNIPYFIVFNKTDIVKPNADFKQKVLKLTKKEIVEFSSVNNSEIESIISAIKLNIPDSTFKISNLLGNKINKNDIVLLITPVDSEAPEGRMILPQVQVLRNVLDNNAICIVLKETELKYYFENNYPIPKMVITDSQVIKKACQAVPQNVPLTGFSVLYAKNKGNFDAYLKGTPKISELKENDKILLLESCTHHVSCDDIGRHKIPKWLKEFTGKNLSFEIVSGLSEMPQNIKEFSLVIQCGACMVTKKQVYNRLQIAIDAGVPVTNYGMAIAWTQGVYNRIIQPFL